MKHNLLRNASQSGQPREGFVSYIRVSNRSSVSKGYIRVSNRSSVSKGYIRVINRSSVSKSYIRVSVSNRVILG